MQFTLSIGFCPPEHYLPLAGAAEEAGWDAVAVPDGLFYYEETSVPYPYSADGKRFWPSDTPFLDPFAVIAAMAAVTRRIHFYPAVLKLAVREPLLVAKELSSCAVLSGGRVALGAGLSPWPEDFEVLRQEWSDRGPRSAEMIEIIHGVLRGGMFEHTGQFYRIPRLEIAPVPGSPVPIYIGGLAEPVLRRAARIADGYIGWESPRCSIAEVAAMIRRMENYRRDYGRAQMPFEYKFMPLNADEETVSRLAEIGVSDVICVPWLAGAGPAASLEEKRAALRRFSDEVIARHR